MIGYTTLGTQDLPRAAAFYDAVLGILKAGRAMEIPERFIAWGNSPTAPMFAITLPFNKEPATVGNGAMVALAAKSREQVDAVYAKAMELGGTCEGPPGARSPRFYAAYFRDLDGNKLNAFFMGE
jgi:catechol 2,3-dioxygenase-like lactoylglutathione lyase family enzyme